MSSFLIKCHKFILMLSLGRNKCLFSQEVQVWCDNKYGSFSIYLCKINIVDICILLNLVCFLKEIAQVSMEQKDKILS